MTRIEKIRAMSDEELATGIATDFGHAYCQIKAECIKMFESMSDEECNARCAKCELAWLREEVPDDGDMA